MPDNLPLVSIVTASYNSRDYLEKAILSVAAQDYPHIEHLIMDGGSTDGTLEILERHRDKVTWISERDKGQSDALNKGWARARGQILGWLDADNTYEPGTVREAVEAISRGIDVVYAGVFDVNEKGEVVREYMPPAFTLRNFLLFHEFNFIPPSSAFIRREAMERAGSLDLSLHYTMDFDLWLRLALVSTIERVPRWWSRFLLRDTSKTGSQMDRFGWDILRVSDKFFARADLPEEVRKSEKQIRARLLQHAADRVILTDHLEGRRLFLRALTTSPLTAPAALWKKVAYLYYRDSFIGRTYRGVKTGLKPVV